jgi:restriction endonuclease S subunit
MKVYADKSFQKDIEKLDAAAKNRFQKLYFKSLRPQQSIKFRTSKRLRVLKIRLESGLEITESEFE